MIRPQLEAQADRWVRIGKRSWVSSPSGLIAVALGQITSRWSTGNTIAVTVPSGGGSQTTIQQPPYVDVEGTPHAGARHGARIAASSTPAACTRRVRVRFYMDPAEGGGVWTVEPAAARRSETEFRGARCPWTGACTRASPRRSWCYAASCNRFGARCPTESSSAMRRASHRTMGLYGEPEHPALRRAGPARGRGSRPTTRHST